VLCRTKEKKEKDSHKTPSVKGENRIQTRPGITSERGLTRRKRELVLTVGKKRFAWSWSKGNPDKRKKEFSGKKRGSYISRRKNQGDRRGGGGGERRLLGQADEKEPGGKQRYPKRGGEKVGRQGVKRKGRVRKKTTEKKKGTPLYIFQAEGSPEGKEEGCSTLLSRRCEEGSGKNSFSAA